uniref:Osiris 11 n=1 Tax=Timema shepardi TaxID=629360 RepID=A0A7R9B5K8_TIMSH|nr:unnamed protein product [Timema shepardi]
MVFQMRIVLLVFFLTLFGAVVNSSESEEETNSHNGVLSGLKVVYHAYQSCESHRDVFACLKMRALRFADRAINADNIPVLGGVTFVKSSEEGRNILEPLQEVTEEGLPEDPEQRNQQLDELLVDRALRFFRGHTVQLSIPEILDEEEDDESLGSARKGKLKKILPYLAMGALLKGAWLTMTYNAVAVLAGKALLVAKVALVLAATLGVKKLFSGGGGGEHVSYEVIKAPHHEEYGGGGGDHYGGGGVEGGSYRRTVRSPEVVDPHWLVYRAYHDSTRS